MEYAPERDSISEDVLNVLKSDTQNSWSVVEIRHNTKKPYTRRQVQDAVRLLVKHGMVEKVFQGRPGRHTISNRFLVKI